MIKRSFFLLDWYYFHTFNQNSEAMTKIILCLFFIRFNINKLQ